MGITAAKLHLLSFHASPPPSATRILCTDPATCLHNDVTNTTWLYLHHLFGLGCCSLQTVFIWSALTLTVTQISVKLLIWLPKWPPQPGVVTKRAYPVKLSGKAKIERRNKNIATPDQCNGLVLLLHKNYIYFSPRQKLYLFGSRYTKQEVYKPTKRDGYQPYINLKYCVWEEP